MKVYLREQVVLKFKTGFNLASSACYESIVVSCISIKFCNSLCRVYIEFRNALEEF